MDSGRSTTCACGNSSTASEKACFAPGRIRDSSGIAATRSSSVGSRDCVAVSLNERRVVKRCFGKGPCDRTSPQRSRVHLHESEARHAKGAVQSLRHVVRSFASQPVACPRSCTQIWSAAGVLRKRCSFVMWSCSRRRSWHFLTERVDSASVVRPSSDGYSTCEVSRAVKALKAVSARVVTLSSATGPTHDPP